MSTDLNFSMSCDQSGPEYLSAGRQSRVARGLRYGTKHSRTYVAPALIFRVAGTSCAVATNDLQASVGG